MISSSSKPPASAPSPSRSPSSSASSLARRRRPCISNFWRKPSWGWSRRRL